MVLDREMHLLDGQVEKTFEFIGSPGEIKRFSPPGIGDGRGFSSSAFVTHSFFFLNFGLGLGSGCVRLR